jgi:hypothetical protein
MEAKEPKKCPTFPGEICHVWRYCEDCDVYGSRCKGCPANMRPAEKKEEAPCSTK